jgi:hypothetical protein
LRLEIDMPRRTKHQKEDQVEEKKQGRPWKKMGIFKNYEDADEKRKELLEYSNDEFQVKVKRHGTGGKQFIVKLRYLSQ